MIYVKPKNKISVIILCILFVASLTIFSSCKTETDTETDEQKPICEISFICNGEMQTLHSTVTPIFSKWNYIDEKEYESAPEKYQFRKSSNNGIYQAMQGQIIFINLSKASSKATTNEGLTEIDKGQEVFLYYTVQVNTNIWIPYYKKAQLIELQYNYVYVDIFDHQTLSIKTWEGTTVYTVSSYSITYFDDLNYS